MSHFVYIIRSETTGRYYIGETSKVEHRLAEHNSGKNRSTKPYRPWKLVHVETFEQRGLARKREQALKSKKSRKILEMVITGP